MENINSSLHNFMANGSDSMSPQGDPTNGASFQGDDDIFVAFPENNNRHDDLHVV